MAAEEVGCVAWPAAWQAATRLARQLGKGRILGFEHGLVGTTHGGEKGSVHMVCEWGAKWLQAAQAQDDAAQGMYQAQRGMQGWLRALWWGILAILWLPCAVGAAKATGGSTTCRRMSVHVCVRPVHSLLPLVAHGETYEQDAR